MLLFGVLYLETGRCDRILFFIPGEKTGEYKFICRIAVLPLDLSNGIKDCDRRGL